KDKGKTCPTLQASPKELIKMMGAPKRYSFGQFNQNVLQPAMNEINLKIDDMYLDMHKVTRGGKVVHIEIYNRLYPRKTKSHDETIEPVPITDWTEDKKNILL